MTTTITIERGLATQIRSFVERMALVYGSDETEQILGSVNTALAAPEQCWCDEQGIGEPGVSCGDCPLRDYTAPATTQIEDHTLDRLLDAWDTTVLPKHRDGAMQEWMEALRHEYRTCPDNSITGRVTRLDFGLDQALDRAAPATAPDRCWCQTFEELVSREGGYLNDSDPEAKSARRIALRAWQAATDAALERAAVVCEDAIQEYEPYTGQPRSLRHTCADAIRALKEQ